MATFEIEGRLTHKLEVQSGQSARGAWTKQSFVIEYQDGNFPASVCFTVFGNDKVAELGRYRTGDQIKVAFNLRAREYNGKWYNDVNVWRFIPLNQGPAANHPQANQAGYGAQFPSQGPAMPPAPTLDDLPGDDPNNDLPF